MIHHLLKIAWNRKRANVILITEILFAYLVVSFLILFLLESTSQLKKTSFSIDNLYQLSIPVKYADLAVNSLQSIDDVQDLSFTDFLPYRNILTRDSMEFNGKKVIASRWRADENLCSVLSLSVQSGRWFNKADRSSPIQSIVLSESLKKALFGDADAIRRLVKVDGRPFNISGIVTDLNDPSGAYNDNSTFFVLDTGIHYIMKLKRPLDHSLYQKIQQALSPFTSEFYNGLMPVSKYRDQFYAKSKRTFFIMFFLSGFLVINVILGLFSMLYQNINSRKSEIGLRRASGSTSLAISLQIVIEVIILTTFAVVPGTVIALQFVFFKTFGVDANYYTSIAIGMLIIYILVIICAIYPAKVASHIQPVDALRNE